MTDKLTTEQIREIVMFHRIEYDGESAEVTGPRFDKWLIAQEMVAFDRGYQQGAQYVAVLNTLWGKKPEREG